LLQNFLLCIDLPHTKRSVQSRGSQDHQVLPGLPAPERIGSSKLTRCGRRLAVRQSTLAAAREVQSGQTTIVLKVA
jgi:hypothetical protein